MDIFESLKKVNAKLLKTEFKNFQRISAILLLPLMVYSGYVTFQHQTFGNQQEQEMWQTVTSRQGMVTQFVLADGRRRGRIQDQNCNIPIVFGRLKRDNT